MNGQPMLILPDHLTLDIFKEQTTVIAGDP